MRYLLPLALACVAPAQNLLTNGDFAKKLDSWSTINVKHMTGLNVKNGWVTWEHIRTLSPPVTYTGISQEITLPSRAAQLRYVVHGANAAAGGSGSYDIVLVPLAKQGPTLLGGVGGIEEFFQMGGSFRDVAPGRWRFECRSRYSRDTGLHTMRLSDIRLHHVRPPYAVYETPEIYAYLFRTIRITSKFGRGDSIAVALFSARRLPAPLDWPGFEGPGLWLDPFAGLFLLPPATDHGRYWVYQPIRGYLQVLELCHRCPTPRWALGSYEKVLR